MAVLIDSESGTGLGGNIRISVRHEGTTPGESFWQGRLDELHGSPPLVAVAGIVDTQIIRCASDLLSFHTSHARHTQCSHTHRS